MVKVTVRTSVVRDQLARRNISQNNLALQAEISQGYLSQLLQGQRHPGPLVRKRLMKALKVREFDELFEFVDAGTTQQEAS